MRSSRAVGSRKDGLVRFDGLVDRERIERSLRVVAALIKDGEPRYWPIFDRLEAELEKQDQRLTKLDRYG